MIPGIDYFRVSVLGAACAVDLRIRRRVQALLQERVPYGFMSPAERRLRLQRRREGSEWELELGVSGETRGMERSPQCCPG